MDEWDMSTPDLPTQVALALGWRKDMDETCEIWVDGSGHYMKEVGWGPDGIGEALRHIGPWCRQRMMAIEMRLNQSCDGAAEVNIYSAVREPYKESIASQSGSTDDEKLADALCRAFVRAAGEIKEGKP